MDTTINDVLAAHNIEGYLVAVSDGSVQYMHQIRFGWVLVSAKGQHLAKSFGVCDGRGNPLRAGAVEMLSISIFIALMAEHRNCTDLKIKYVTNNLELVNKSNKHLKYKNLYPNNTLSFEYEIIEKST